MIKINGIEYRNREEQLIYILSNNFDYNKKIKLLLQLMWATFIKV